MDDLVSRELDALLSGLERGTLQAAQQERLATLYRQYPEARKRSEAFFHEGRPGAERSFWRRPLVVLGVSGALALGVGLLLYVTFVWRPADTIPTSLKIQTEPASKSVAKVLQVRGAEGENTQAGTLLSAGPWHLESGLALIQFFDGTTVILEGPADLDVQSVSNAFCKRGKLRGIVPAQAQGFTIGSPQLHLVSLTGEFGLQVDDGGKTQVHVYQGKLQVHEMKSDGTEAMTKVLTSGQGLSLDEAGIGSSIKADPTAVPTAKHLANKVTKEEVPGRYKEWLKVSQALRQDPRVLVCYTFESADLQDRTLRDQAKGGTEPHDGVIVGCEWVAGRWPQTKALEFKEPSDRVLIDIPGEHNAVTFMAWVRLNRLENKLNALLLGDNWGDSTPHWQIYGDGRITFGIRHNRTEFEAVVTKPVVVGSASLHHWIQLACVYDANTGKISHYLNGEARMTQEMKFRRPLKLGSAGIGNWRAQPGSQAAPVRYLNGRMDEFILFNEALDEAEIQKLYQAGKSGG